MTGEFVRENGKTYIRVAGEDDTDTVQMKMIMENKTDIFLPLSMYRINDKAFYRYDISSMMVMTACFEDTDIHADDIKLFAACVKRAFAEADRYLVDGEGVILDPEYIFYDGSGKWHFLYYIKKESSYDEGLKKLSEYMIKHVCHKDGRASAIAYGIYKRISDGECSIEKIFEIEESEKIREPEVVEEKHVIESVMPQIIQEEEEVPDKFKIYAVYGVAGIWSAAVLITVSGILFPRFRIKGSSMPAYVAVLVLLAIIGFGAYRWYDRTKDRLFKIKTTKKEIPYEKENIRILIPGEKAEEKDGYTVVLNEQQPTSNHMLTWEENNCRRTYDLNEDVCIIGSASDKAD